MKTEKTPASIWREYQSGQSFKSGISLYEKVEQNENFYLGNQWEGVSAPDLDKPVMNILRRVVSYFLSHVISDDIAVNVSDFSDDAGQKQVLAMLGVQFAKIMENTSSKRKFRDALRNAAVDGDACLHYYFDTDIKAEKLNGLAGTGGGVAAEIIDNTNVVFGNPQSSETEKQPYILLAFRRFTQDVQASAKEHGQDPAAIARDSDHQVQKTGQESGKTTVVRKYWKENGNIWFCEVCEGGFVTPPTQTAYTLYPLVWLCWEKVKNCYHGQAAITSLIPNQIFINKLFAMAMQHVKMMAFPKVVYNRNVFPNGWSNKVGAALGVNGDPNQAVASSFRTQDMSSQVLLMIDRVMQYTKDTMGASDAALGNVNPQNTSAIIATQKATGMPLELQKMEFFNMVEESVRIWLDIMQANYGKRPVQVVSENNTSETIMFDFSSLAEMQLKLNIDIGAATYWSEVMQLQTLDNLYSNKIIDDAALYLEMLPSGCLPNKQHLIEEINKKAAQKEAEAGNTLAYNGQDLINNL